MDKMKQHSLKLYKELTGAMRKMQTVTSLPNPFTRENVASQNLELMQYCMTYTACCTVRNAYCIIFSVHCIILVTHLCSTMGDFQRRKQLVCPCHFPQVYLTTWW